MMSWRFYTLVGLLGLTIAVTLWLHSLREHALYELPRTNKRVPDQILEGITLSSTDSTGKLRYRIKAVAMAYFNDDGSTELDAPWILFYSEDESPLQIRSERAWASESRDTILLQGKVHIVQPKSQTRMAYTIKTEDVHVLPNERVASTDQRLVAITDNARIQGVGGEIDLTAGTVTIRTQVRGTYEP